MLLGRVRRPSIGSLEALEMERPSPKIIKDDALSIYETTLIKLKEGSRHCDSLHLADAMSIDVSCVTESDCSETTAADCSSPTSLNSTREQLTSMTSLTSNEQRNKSPSVLYLFSKYKSSKNGPNSPYEETMVRVEGTVCSSPSASPCVCNSEPTSNQRQQLSEECFESSII